MEWLGYYLALGAFVGFFAGMLGIGGGGVMVPLLVWLMGLLGAFTAFGYIIQALAHLVIGFLPAFMAALRAGRVGRRLPSGSHDHDAIGAEVQGRTHGRDLPHGAVAEVLAVDAHCRKNEG